MPAVETRALGHTIAWNPLVPAVVLLGVMFEVLYVYPYLERWVTAGRGEHHLCDRPRNQPARTGLGVAGIVFYAVLLAAGGDDVIAYSFGISRRSRLGTAYAGATPRPPSSTPPGPSQTGEEAP